MKWLIPERTSLDDEAETVAAFERNAACSACFFDAGDGAQPLDTVADEALDGVSRRVLWILQRHPHRQHVARVEPWIDRSQRKRGSDKQRRADEQHQGEGNLRDHERCARLVLTEAGARAPGAFLECRAEICARRLKGRNEPEQDSGRDRDKERECDDAPVDRDERAALADSREVRRIDREERANAGDAQHEAERAACQGEDDAFGEQLSHDARASGSDRRTDGDLAPSSGRTDKKEVRDVGACDKEHETHGAGENHERRSDVAHDHVVYPLDGEAPVRP